MEIIVSGNTIVRAIVTEINSQIIIQRPQANIVELTTVGPQGPASFGFADFAEIQNVNATDKTDKSLVYYDEGTDTYKIDSVVTISKLSDGGNF